MNPIQILLLGSQMTTGGAQKVLLDQAEWFHNQGYKVTAVFFYDRDNLHDTWAAKTPCPVINLAAFKKGAGVGVNVFLLSRGIIRLWKLLRREKPQIVESFTHDSNMLALPTAWMAGIPVRIATHHGVVAGIQPWREKIHAFMINIGLAYRIVAVSSLAKEKLLEEGIRKDKITVIHNGIKPVAGDESARPTTRKEMGFDADDFLLLSVGRLVPSKAHHNLIAALPDAIKINKHIRVGILGDGELRETLQKQIDSLGLTNKVKLLGVQENVPKYLFASDVFILPSLWEGLPMALLEAMSAGLPVIVTNVEGMEEVVENEKHGLLINPGSVHEITQAILQLSARSPSQLRTMGEEGRTLISSLYTTDMMCKKYVEVFEKGISETKRY